MTPIITVAYLSVLACALFAAISGSSPATVMAVGSILIPAMVKQGYPPQFGVGTVTSAPERSRTRWTSSGRVRIIWRTPASIPPSSPRMIFPGTALLSTKSPSRSSASSTRSKRSRRSSRM